MCLQADPSTVKPPRVTALLLVLVFVVGFGIAWAILWGRGAAGAERLRSVEADNARLAGELASEKAATLP